MRDRDARGMFSIFDIRYLNQNWVEFRRLATIVASFVAITRPGGAKCKIHSHLLSILCMATLVFANGTLCPIPAFR